MKILQYDVVLTLAVILAAVPGFSGLAMGQGAAGGQGAPGGFGGRGAGGFLGGGNTELTLVANAQVQEALELVPTQVREIEELNAGVQEKMRSVFAELREGGDGDREAQAERMRKKMSEVVAETKGELDQILLPHQSKRLKQITFQMESRGRGNSVVNSDRVGDALKLSEAQKEKLKAKADELEKQLKERIAKIRKEAEDELLTVLTVQQRDEYKELMGEPFELPQNLGFGAAGAGFGQPGGARRGGGNRSGN